MTLKGDSVSADGESQRTFGEKQQRYRDKSANITHFWVVSNCFRFLFLIFFFLFKASHLTLQVFIRFFSLKEFFEQKCDNKVFPCLFLQKQWSPCRSGRLMFASVLHKPPERCD